MPAFFFSGGQTSLVRLSKPPLPVFGDPNSGMKKHPSLNPSPK